jgi:hemerythrin superfamily protein
VEHASVKDLVSQIESGDPADDLFDAKVKVLGEYVTHHVKEEEGELFPKLEKTDLDLDVLGTELAERKQELMSALADDAGNVPPTPAKSKKGGNRTSPNR